MAGDKIHVVDMDKVKLYENLSIGDETWLCISALEEEMDTKPFFLCVIAFYSATLQKFFKKFPWFPRIELDSPDSLHLLAQELTDFLLYPEDLPALRYNKDCNGVVGSW